MPRLNANVSSAAPIDPDDACLDEFQRELDYIHATLRRFGAAPSDIEDLTQEVFLILHAAWARFDRTRPLRPYLFGIAYRIALSHRRKHRREVQYGGIEALTDGTVDLEEAVQSRQARQLVLSALERVPLPRRAVLLMHDLDDVPVAEIASVLGLRLFTVYSRLRKARRELASGLRRLLRRTRDEVVGRHAARPRATRRASVIPSPAATEDADAA